MSFLTGKITALRFAVDGPSPRIFDAEHLNRLDDFKAGRQKIASSDGIETGWVAGDHFLDTDFQPAKNIIGDWLCFDLWIQTDKLPSDRLKAYYEVELKAIAAGNPSGRPSAMQKKQAKESARDLLEAEAKLIPVAWHRKTNCVYLGSTSLAQADRFAALFQQTFGHGLMAQSAGRRVTEEGWDDLQEYHLSPTAFTPNSGNGIAWIADETSRDFLGNEFLLWLWWYGECVSDMLKLSDESAVMFMIARKIKLECPRGSTGRDVIDHEGPSRLPEAKRAIQAGKLPRSMGLTVVRRGDQWEFSFAAETWEFSLAAETLAICGMKLPNGDENITEPHARLIERLDSFAAGVETIDLMYECFLNSRLSSRWTDDLKQMQKWLTKGELQRGT